MAAGGDGSRVQGWKLVNCGHVKSCVNLLSWLLIGCSLLTQLMIMTTTHKFPPLVRVAISFPFPASVAGGTTAAFSQPGIAHYRKVYIIIGALLLYTIIIQGG